MWKRAILLDGSSHPSGTRKIGELLTIGDVIQYLEWYDPNTRIFIADSRSSDYMVNICTAMFKERSYEEEEF